MHEARADVAWAFGKRCEHPLRLWQRQWQQQQPASLPHWQKEARCRRWGQQLVFLMLQATGRLLLCPRARWPQQQQLGWQEMEVHQSQTRHSGTCLPQQQTLTWWTLV